MSASEEQRLHIGLVTPGFSADEEDWCIPALLTMVRRLTAAHDVSVYTLRYPHRAHTYKVSGARVRALGGATRRGWRRLPLLRRAIRTIVADEQEKPFSIIHGLWADEAGFVASLAAQRCGVPSLVSLMGGELVRLPEINYGVQLSRSGRFLTTLALRRADVVSAGSRQLLEQVEQRAPDARLRLLPLGVDLSLFRPDAPPSGPPYRIVHAASLNAVKDQETLLAAFAHAAKALPAGALSLHVAGDGPLRETLQTRAGALGVGRLVHFYGAIRHEEMPPFYASGHLFALSSRHESQSVALLEAAACGLPAVGTAVGLLAELLPESLLARPGNAQRLAEAILKLLRDESARQEEARRLQAVVRERYGLHKTVGRLLEVYWELAEGVSGRGDADVRAAHGDAD